MWNFRKQPIKVHVDININDKKLDEILAIVKQLQQDNMDLQKIVKATKDLDASTNQLTEAIKKNTPNE